MTALLRSEVQKLLATRSFLAIAGALMAYPVLPVLVAATAPDQPILDPGIAVEVARGAADVLIVAALLLGIVAAAGEYRHGTIVPSLLAAPRRSRFVAAKLGSQATAGLLLGLAVVAASVAAGTAYLASRDVTVDVVSADVLLTAGAVLLVTSLYATIGAAVGSIVRNQTAAVAGALVWILTAENAVPLVLRRPGIKRWLPGGAADRLLHVADPVAGALGAWAALVILAGLAAVLAAVAVVVTRSSDVH